MSDDTDDRDPGRSGWLRDAERVDAALYAAVAATPTPDLDRMMGAISSVADRSALWVAASAALVAARGHRGRQAAGLGLASIAVTSIVVNAAAKPVLRRRRPDRELHAVPVARHVPMPRSRSLPSGHAASAFAFATGVGHVLPREAVVLRAAAAVVGYSRIHTGVHFPGDVVLGALMGTSLAEGTIRAVGRRSARRRRGLRRG